MNREQKRAFIKKAKKDGMSKDQAELFVRLKEGGAKPQTDPNDISDGQLVSINAESIKARQGYDKMREDYREFVEGSEDKIFTAHIAQQGKAAKIITLDDYPWYFWCGDLIRVEYINEFETDYSEEDDFFDYGEEDDT